MVFQRPWGTLAGSLYPRAAHPRKGAIPVRVQVSLMKRSASLRLLLAARSRSPAATHF